MPYKCEHFIELAVSFDLFISPVVIFKMLSSARPTSSPELFQLKNGWGGKRPWHRLVTCPLVHPKILGVIISAM